MTPRLESIRQSNDALLERVIERYRDQAPSNIERERRERLSRRELAYEALSWLVAHAA